MNSQLVIIPARRAHSNHAEVARTIGIDIIAGRYPEGAKIPGDAELTLIFGVSRPVLRESVKTLVAKGLLTTKARVGTVTVRIYMLSSVLAGLSGIVFTFYTSSGYSLSAVGVELDTIAAVVIGGTMLSGGYGFMFGTFVGVLIQGLIQTYITFDGSLSSWWTKIATGMLLFAFIAFQQILVVLARRPVRRAAGVVPS